MQWVVWGEVPGPLNKELRESCMMLSRIKSQFKEVQEAGTLMNSAPNNEELFWLLTCDSHLYFGTGLRLTCSHVLVWKSGGENETVTRDGTGNSLPVSKAWVIRWPAGEKVWGLKERWSIRHNTREQLSFLRGESWFVPGEKEAGWRKWWTRDRKPPPKDQVSWL